MAAIQAGKIIEHYSIAKFVPRHECSHRDRLVDFFNKNGTFHGMCNGDRRYLKISKIMLLCTVRSLY